MTNTRHPLPVLIDWHPVYARLFDFAAQERLARQREATREIDAIPGRMRSLAGCLADTQEVR